LGKEVTAFWKIAPMLTDGQTLYTGNAFDAKLLVVNAFWITFSVFVTGGEISEPMANLLLSWDDNKKRLKVLVTHESAPSIPQVGAAVNLGKT
jgi:hypothetical protein